ncbi:hypothetical protein GCM10023221_35810 [Luteimicrobium xylanilyticum]
MRAVGTDPGVRPRRERGESERDDGHRSILPRPRRRITFSPAPPARREKGVMQPRRARNDTGADAALGSSA